MKNKTPYDNNDRLSFSLDYKYENYKDFNNLSDFESTSSGGGEIGEIDGDNVDISESYLFPADEFVKIRYTVNKNNIESVFSDSILIKRDKITDYQIEY